MISAINFHRPALALAIGAVIALLALTLSGGRVDGAELEPPGAPAPSVTTVSDLSLGGPALASQPQGTLAGLGWRWDRIDQDLSITVAVSYCAWQIVVTPGKDLEETLLRYVRCIELFI